MATNLHTIQGDLTPVKNRVLVRDMYFGEQKTAGGKSSPMMMEPQGVYILDGQKFMPKVQLIMMTITMVIGY